MNRLLLRILAIVVIVCIVIGLRQFKYELKPPRAKNIYNQSGFLAEEYFNNRSIIELCYAIEDNDIKKINELIDDGVNINSRGKNQVTPLLWAMVDHRLEAFNLLLDHGADPNVKLTHPVGKFHSFHSTTTVTLESCKTPYAGFIDQIFAHGGDIHEHDDSKKNPIQVVMDNWGRPFWRHRIQMLVDRGCDINEQGPTITSLTSAVSPIDCSGQLLFLLERGANPYVHHAVVDYVNPPCPQFPWFIQYVVWRGSMRLPYEDNTYLGKVRYQRLLEWLDMHGLDSEQARRDKDKYFKVKLQAGLGILSPEYERLVKEYVARIEFEKLQPKTYLQIFDLIAEDCFEDPQIAKLCKAIESKDLAEVKTLVNEGIDVNSVGLDNLTPLMWAYLANDLEIFKTLLANGADPTIRLSGDAGRPNAFIANQSVQSRCLKTATANYFEAVVASPKFDPRMRDEYGLSSFQQLLTHFDNKSHMSRMQLLLNAKADVNDYDVGTYPPLFAAFDNFLFEECVWLLEHGADIDTISPEVLGKLEHVVTRYIDDRMISMRDLYIRKVDTLPAKTREHFDRLVAFLESHGRTIQNARQEGNVWKKKRSTPQFMPEYSNEVKQEIYEQNLSAKKPKGS